MNDIRRLDPKNSSAKANFGHDQKRNCFTDSKAQNQSHQKHYKEKVRALELESPSHTFSEVFLMEKVGCHVKSADTKSRVL